MLPVPVPWFLIFSVPVMFDAPESAVRIEESGKIQCPREFAPAQYPCTSDEAARVEVSSVVE